MLLLRSLPSSLGEPAMPPLGPPPAFGSRLLHAQGGMLMRGSPQPTPLFATLEPGMGAVLQLRSD